MKIIRFISVIFIVISVFSCQNKSTKPKNRVIVDGLGRKVEIPLKVERIVGVKAGALRLISYLGASQMVIGVEDVELKNANPYNLANPQYADLPSIGPIHGGDAELISSRKPDLIIMSNCNVGDADKLQSLTGIPVVAVVYGDLSENRKYFVNALNILGDVLGKKNRADSLLVYIDELIKDLGERSMSNKNLVQKIYVGGISFHGMHGLSSTDPNYPPFTFLNINNLSKEFSRGGNIVSIDKEQIIKWNPDFIFVDYSGLELVIKDLNLLSKSLDVIEANNVYGLLPHNWYTTNFETVLVNAYNIGNVVTPSSYSDLNIEVKSREIYKTFLGQDVYNKMAEKHGIPCAKINLNDR